MPPDFEGPQINADKQPKFKKGDRVIWTNPNKVGDRAGERRHGTVEKDSGTEKTLVLLDGDALSQYLYNVDLERLTN